MKRTSVFLICIASTQLGATDCGQVLEDPGFDLWCGEELCSWELARGEVRRAPTWHSADAGVELVGSDAAIWQRSPVESADGDCIHFELVANVGDDVEALLSVDVFGDGTIERSERLPASKWKPLSYNLRIKPPYDGIRFELSKRGDGIAVLGRIHAELAPGGCAGLPEIDGGPGPRVSCGDPSGSCR